MSEEGDWYINITFKDVLAELVERFGATKSTFLIAAIVAEVFIAIPTDRAQFHQAYQVYLMRRALTVRIEATRRFAIPEDVRKRGTFIIVFVDCHCWWNEGVCCFSFFFFIFIFNNGLQ